MTQASASVERAPRARSVRTAWLDIPGSKAACVSHTSLTKALNTGLVIKRHILWWMIPLVQQIKCCEWTTYGCHFTQTYEQHCCYSQRSLLLYQPAGRSSICALQIFVGGVIQCLKQWGRVRRRLLVQTWQSIGCIMKHCQSRTRKQPQAYTGLSQLTTTKIFVLTNTFIQQWVTLRFTCYTCYMYLLL